MSGLPTANNHDGNEREGAYNSDGSYHQCLSKQSPPSGMPAEVKKQQPLTLQDIDLRLKRVEAMLFNATEK